ncbi:MAG: universal stress protein [Thermoplasmata archaeon]
MNTPSRTPIHANSRPPPALRMLVGYDGSDASYRAVQFALGIARRGGAAIWLVHAAQPPALVMEPRTDEEQASEVDAIGEVLRDLQEEATREGVTLTAWSRGGSPITVLLAAADEIKADWIVVGTRGLRGAARTLLGSVSAALLDRSGRPVTVVP